MRVPGFRQLAVGTVGDNVSMCTYRVIHRLHHNHLYGPQDPDIALHDEKRSGQYAIMSA